MSDITLKVPDGNDCLGCMFLDIDYHHNNTKCGLFNEDLYSRIKYGNVEESSIRKCDRCPTSD